MKFAAGVALKGKVAFTNSSPEPAMLIAGEYADLSLIHISEPTRPY